MPLIETESFILKSYNLAEADKIVLFLTRSHGVVRGVAKGAKRLKSKFGSGLEPFSVVWITYYEKEVLELVSIQKADLLISYFAAASNPEFLAKFSYLTDLLISLSPPRDPNENLYRMMKACIDVAANDKSTLAGIGFYFELWLLRLAGYLPDWSKCEECSRILNARETANVQANFRLLCANCRKSAGTLVVGGPHREIFADAQRLSPADFAVFASSKPNEIKETSQMLKRIISQAVGRDVTESDSLAANSH